MERTTCARRGVRVRVAVAAVLAAVASVPAQAPAASTVAATCRAADLRGLFALVFGSNGMGHVEYRLRLTNVSQRPCLVAAWPALRLLDRSGRPLPTRVTRGRSAAAPRPVLLASGETALATALFSPDIPGRGDVQSPGRTCEPIAHELRIGVPRGSLVAPVSPPTPVCERGGMLLTPLTASGGVHLFFLTSGRPVASCELAAGVPGLGTFAYCELLPSRQLAVSVRLTASGALHVCRGVRCSSNPPLNASSLLPGRSVQGGPFRCTSLPAGVRCLLSRLGHGFLLGPRGVTRV